MTKSYLYLDSRLEKEKSKLNEMVIKLGCLHEETIKQSQLVDKLIILKMRRALQQKAV